MYQTTTINVSERLGLADGPDGPYEVEVIPIVWLPYETAEKFAEWEAANDAVDMASVTPEQMAEQERKIGSILSEVVVKWNLRTVRGEEIEVPTEENPLTWKALPTKIIELITEVASEDDGEIPLVNGPSSSDDSLHPQPQNREQRRALAQTSQDGSSGSS